MARSTTSLLLKLINLQYLCIGKAPVHLKGDDSTFGKYTHNITKSNPEVGI